jgi:hypothetical protein
MIVRMSERGTLASVLGYVFIGSGNSSLAVASYNQLVYNTLKATNKENQEIQIQCT